MMKVQTKIVRLLIVLLSVSVVSPIVAQDNGLVGEIVFSSDGNIFVMDLVSKSVSQLTQDGTNTSPRWSPDGETIAYVSDGDVHLMNADGNSSRQMTDLGDVIWYPVWSPESNEIAFVTGQHEETWSIYVVSIENARVRQLIEQSASWSAIHNDSTPVWSPDGQFLLFELFHESEDIRGVYVIDVDTKESHRILEGYPPAGNASWSPDGELIVYNSYGAQDEYGIFVSDLEGNKRRRISGCPECLGRPMWSPDGEIVVISSGMNWFFSICLDFVNRDDYFGCFNDGSNVYRYPVWSPDGKYILFQQYADETDAFPGAEPLKVLDVWKGEIHPLGVTAGEYMMDWRPVTSEN